MKPLQGSQERNQWRGDDSPRHSVSASQKP